MNIGPDFKDVDWPRFTYENEIQLVLANIAKWSQAYYLDASFHEGDGLIALFSCAPAAYQTVANIREWWRLRGRKLYTRDHGALLPGDRVEHEALIPYIAKDLRTLEGKGKYVPKVLSPYVYNGRKEFLELTPENYLANVISVYKQYRREMAELHKKEVSK